MPISIEKLLEEGEEIEGAARRKGKKKAKKEGGMPRAEPCSLKSSRYCMDVCSGHSYCPKNIHRIKELAGYTLIRPWMGIAIDHPDWVGKWKKL